MPFFNQKNGGFDVQIEKTALRTSGEVVPVKKSFTSHDTMLMFAIADVYSPEPREIEVNGTTININEDFLTNRIAALQAVYNAMPTVEDMRIELIVNESGPVKWVIQNE